MQAFNTLTDTGKMTSAFNLAMDFSKSLSALRAVFQELDRKGIQFPSDSKKLMADGEEKDG